MCVIRMTGSISRCFVDGRNCNASGSFSCSCTKYEKRERRKDCARIPPPDRIPQGLPRAVEGTVACLFQGPQCPKVESPPSPYRVTAWRYVQACGTRSFFIMMSTVQKKKTGPNVLHCRGHAASSDGILMFGEDEKFC